MLDERKEQCCFCKRCLLIFMTFYEFPKPGVNFHDFSRPGKKIMEFHDFSRFSTTGYTLNIWMLLHYQRYLSILKQALRYRGKHGHTHGIRSQLSDCTTISEIPQYKTNTQWLNKLGHTCKTLTTTLEIPYYRNIAWKKRLNAEF